jgi:transcriptional regulator with GAF, ATPase, and Fis domain
MIQVIHRSQVESISPEREMIGCATGLRQVWRAIQLVASSESGVLIHGETGTGNELVARAIHQQSQRRTVRWSA